MMLLGALALFLAGCSTESALPQTDIAPFKNDPRVAVELASINGANVTVNISATNFKAIDPATATSTHVYGEGHYHLFLDVPPTAPGEITPHAPGIYHTPESTYTIRDVKDGHHHLSVVLGFSDHTPYQDVAQRGTAVFGAIASIDFVTGSGATKVTAPPPSATPSAAPSSAASVPSASAPAASAPATASGGSTTSVKIVADATNGGAYNPGSVSVAVGGTVEWTWEDDSASHTVTAEDGKFDSGLQSKGQKFSQTFKAAGTYKYKCSVHPQMLGTVTVK
ncbi:MAG: cupredoxin domain-containing protein [Candidatus Dormibacteria bacterium]